MKICSCNPIAALLAFFLTLTSGVAQTHPAQLPSPLVQTALALEQQGKLTEAETVWRSVIKAQPANAQAYAHLGLIQARQQHYPEAIAQYRKAKALQPTLPQLNLNLGLALFKSEEYAEAAPLFESELKHHPADADTQRLTILAGMSEYARQHYALAAPYLKQAAEHDSQNLPLRLSLAHCYLWTKQYEETMAVYKEILAINPNSAEADMIAGEALDGKGDTAGAIEQFRAAVQANPKEPNAHFGLAYLLWTQKEYEAAIPEFQAELANDPQNTLAMIYLGDAALQLEKYDQARIVLQQAIALHSPAALIHLDLGIIAVESGDNAAAVRELTEAIRIEPGNVKAHFRLGQTYRNMGKLAEAKAELAKASSLNQKTDTNLQQRIAEASAHPERHASEQKSEEPQP